MQAVGGMNWKLKKYWVSSLSVRRDEAVLMNIAQPTLATAYMFNFSETFFERIPVFMYRRTRRLFVIGVSMTRGAQKVCLL